MCVTANVFLLFAPNFRRLLRNREFLLLLYIIWSTMKCIYACVNTFNWTFIGLKKVNRFTFRLNKLSVWLWGNICTKCIGNTAIINTFGLDKLLYIHSFKKIQQGCSWERQQRKSGAETEEKKRMGEGMREEGADGASRGVGVHPICCAFVARAERVNRTPMQLHPAGFPSTQKEQVLKPLSLNVLLLNGTTTGSFLIFVPFFSLLNIKAKARWSELAQRSSQHLGPGVCGCTCTPPCWRGVGRVRAFPRSSR